MTTFLYVTIFALVVLLFGVEIILRKPASKALGKVKWIVRATVAYFLAMTLHYLTVPAIIVWILYIISMGIFFYLIFIYRETR